jgi:3-isopropylmalate/(R)-2-methylmalate dehydratase small subunit
MDAFTRHRGLAAPLPRANVDTDAIIPKRFLRSILRTGFGEHLFDEWRFMDRTEPGAPPRDRIPNKDFVLNQPRYRDATILVTQGNFGCGSSREHAAWALQQYGFRAVIAPSFGEIFFGNAFKNGLLPIVLPQADVERILGEAVAHDGYALEIDLDRQIVTSLLGDVFRFDIDSSRKVRLLNGLDDVALTLRHAQDIEQFEARRRAQEPWLIHGLENAARLDPAQP